MTPLERARANLSEFVEDARKHGNIRTAPVNVEDLEMVLGASGGPSMAGWDADEFDAWFDIVRMWSGSKFLAGEKMSRAQQVSAKGQLYSDLCRLGNHLMGWRDQAATTPSPSIPASPSPTPCDLDLEALARVARAATQGEWRQGRLGDPLGGRHCVDFGEPPKSPFMVIYDGGAGSLSVRPTPAKGIVHSDDGSSAHNAAHVATFQPSTVLKLIALASPRPASMCAAPMDLAEPSPGHTDLMVTPESIGPWLEKDSGASTICDFMGWPEDGPAWGDAHKLYGRLRPPVTEEEVEKAARIIDEKAWAFHDFHKGDALMHVEIKREVVLSLIKARQILTGEMEP